MPILYSYPLAVAIASGDLLTGTQVAVPASSNNPTVTWAMSTLSAFVQTDIGAITAYNDDVAAGVGGLAAGQLYQTTGLGAAPLNAAGIVMIKQ